MKKALLLFPFLTVALGCGGNSRPAAATPQSGGRISVSPNSTLLHCIGTAPGQPPPQKIGPSPATMNYCRQLPGWDLYEEAGQHFKSGDHAGAAKIVISSAKAGNPIAQLRLAMLYEAGDGVPRDKKKRSPGISAPPRPASLARNPKSAAITKRATAWPKTGRRPRSGINKARARAG